MASFFPQTRAPPSKLFAAIVQIRIGDLRVFAKMEDNESARFPYPRVGIVRSWPQRNRDDGSCPTIHFGLRQRSD